MDAVLLKTNKIKRSDLLKRLVEYDIHGRATFPRMSLFPMYEARFKNPVATEVMHKGFNLPSAFNLTRKDIKFVCEKIIKIIRHDKN